MAAGLGCAVAKQAEMSQYFCTKTVKIMSAPKNKLTNPCRSPGYLNGCLLSLNLGQLQTLGAHNQCIGAGVSPLLHAYYIVYSAGIFMSDANHVI